MLVELITKPENEKAIVELMGDLGVTNKQELVNIAMSLLAWSVAEIKNNPKKIIGSINEEAGTYIDTNMESFNHTREKYKI